MDGNVPSAEPHLGQSVRSWLIHGIRTFLLQTVYVAGITINIRPLSLACKVGDLINKRTLRAAATVI